MVGAEAVLGEEQVLGPITPLLLPIGIWDRENTVRNGFLSFKNLYSV